MEHTALVTGFMISASAFITVAGIILAIDRSERLGILASTSLLISLVFGTTLIIMSLNWLDKPPDSMWLGWFWISLQLLTFYPPMWKLIIYRHSIPRGENMLGEEEKELNVKMDRLASECLEKALNNLDNPESEKPDAENLSLIFTYKNTANLVKLSENLVRSTDKLKLWTIAIAVLTFFMICTTIANIVVVATQ